jgi:hypothetical protein
MGQSSNFQSLFGGCNGKKLLDSAHYPRILPGWKTTKHSDGMFWLCIQLITVILPLYVFRRNPRFDMVWSPVLLPVPLSIWQWSQPLLSVCCVSTRPGTKCPSQLDAIRNTQYRHIWKFYGEISIYHMSMNCMNYPMWIENKYDKSP